MSRYKQPYSLYKRGNYWYYKTYSPDGVRTCGKTTGCTSKNQARSYCDQLYKDGNLWNHEIKYAEYTSNFFNVDGLYFSDRQKAPSEHTIIQYQSIQKNHLLPYFQKMNLADINYTTIKRFRIYLTEKGLSTKSISLIMTILKVVIEYAYRDRLIINDPFAYIKPLKNKSKHRDAFTLEEVKIIYNSIGERFKNQILVMALTGMRIKESLAQSSDDIVDADGFSYINLKYQMYASAIKKSLKNNSMREIPIIPELIPFIYWNEQIDDFYAEMKKIKSTFDNCEDRNLSFHSLRHFFITNSKAAGVMPIKVEYLAGHSLKGIENVYTNFKASDVVDILEWQKKIFDYLNK